MNRVISEVRTHHDCYCVVLDCSRDEIFLQGASQLMSSLAEAIALALQREERYAVVGSTKNVKQLSTATAELLAVVSSSDKPVLIFIDEFDYITPGSPTTDVWREDFNKFWRNFRSVYQEAGRVRKCLSVMISGVSAKWFAVESIEGVENAALAFIPEEYLSPLAREASTSMIKKIGRTAGLSFSEAAANAISSACSDMPFWIRKGCSYLHRHIPVEGRPMAVEKETVETLMADFIVREGSTVAQVAVSHLLRIYPELKIPCLELLKDSVPLNKQYLAVLRKYGVASQSGVAVISGAMMRAALVGVREQQSSEFGEADTVKQLSLPTSALLEWAEELAVLNKNRNLMEKRMRQLVLNFLRADSMQNKSRGSARDRVFSVIPDYRRKSLVSIASADDLMEKLLWLELKILVVKEWQVLEGVFADKKQFEQHAEIANDRPDAHAKDVDGAELALQRRSIGWLSDRLAAV